MRVGDPTSAPMSRTEEAEGSASMSDIQGTGEDDSIADMTRKVLIAEYSQWQVYGTLLTVSITFLLPWVCVYWLEMRVVSNE